MHDTAQDAMSDMWWHAMHTNPNAARDEVGQRTWSSYWVCMVQCQEAGARFCYACWATVVHFYSLHVDPTFYIFIFCRVRDLSTCYSLSYISLADNQWRYDKSDPSPGCQPVRLPKLNFQRTLNDTYLLATFANANYAIAYCEQSITLATEKEITAPRSCDFFSTMLAHTFPKTMMTTKRLYINALYQMNYYMPMVVVNDYLQYQCSDIYIVQYYLQSENI